MILLMYFEYLFSICYPLLLRPPTTSTIPPLLHNTTAEMRRKGNTGPSNLNSFNIMNIKSTIKLTPKQNSDASTIQPPSPRRTFNPSHTTPTPVNESHPSPEGGMFLAKIPSLTRISEPFPIFTTRRNCNPTRSSSPTTSMVSPLQSLLPSFQNLSLSTIHPQNQTTSGEPLQSRRYIVQTDGSPSHRLTPSTRDSASLSRNLRVIKPTTTKKSGKQTRIKSTINIKTRIITPSSPDPVLYSRSPKINYFHL